MGDFGGAQPFKYSAIYIVYFMAISKSIWRFQQPACRRVEEIQLTLMVDPTIGGPRIAALRTAITHRKNNNIKKLKWSGISIFKLYFILHDWCILGGTQKIDLELLKGAFNPRIATTICSLNVIKIIHDSRMSYLLGFIYGYIFNNNTV